MVLAETRQRGIGYDSDDENDNEEDNMPNTLQSHFVPYGKQNYVRPKGRTVSKPKAKAKPHTRSNHAFMYRYPAQKPKFVKNFGKTNPKGPRKI